MGAKAGLNNSVNRNVALTNLGLFRLSLTIRDASVFLHTRRLSRLSPFARYYTARNPNNSNLRKRESLHNFISRKINFIRHETQANIFHVNRFFLITYASEKRMEFLRTKAASSFWKKTSESRYKFDEKQRSFIHRILARERQISRKQRRVTFITEIGFASPFDGRMFSTNAKLRGENGCIRASARIEGEANRMKRIVPTERGM